MRPPVVSPPFVLSPASGQEKGRPLDGTTGDFFSFFPLPRDRKLELVAGPRQAAGIRRPPLPPSLTWPLLRETPRFFSQTAASALISASFSLRVLFSDAFTLTGVIFSLIALRCDGPKPLLQSSLRMPTPSSAVCRGSFALRPV